MTDAGPPWQTEERVDAQRAAKLIERRFGIVGEVSALGAGWDNAAFEIDGHAFLFPKRANVVPHLRQAILLLPQLQTLPLPVPNPEWIAEPDAEFPFPFMGYRKLPGVPAYLVDAVDAESVVRQVVEFVDALHGLPVEGAEHFKGWGGGAPAPPDHPIAERAQRWLADADPESDTDVLLHADLGGEHVLVDPDTSRVTGIIDWTDMEWGDPARDFSGLARWRPDLLDAALSDRPGLAERASRHAVRAILADWSTYVRWNDDERAAAARDRLATALDRMASSRAPGRSRR